MPLSDDLYSVCTIVTGPMKKDGLKDIFCLNSCQCSASVGCTCT